MIANWDGAQKLGISSLWDMTCRGTPNAAGRKGETGERGEIKVLEQSTLPLLHLPLAPARRERMAEIH